MTRLTFAAAALAAGMTTFAAHAQEAPVNFADAFVAAPAKAESSKGARKEAAPRISSAHEGRGMHHISTGEEVVTRAKTSKAPELVAIARKAGAGTRKKIILKDKAEIGEAVAVAKLPTAKGGNGRYHAIVTRYASEYGVPASLAHAVIRIESNYRANARGRAGEVGLMQIKPSTARGMGYSGSIKALYNPETKTADVRRWLGEEAAHDHHHDHDHVGHDQEIGADVLVCEHLQLAVQPGSMRVVDVVATVAPDQSRLTELAERLIAGTLQFLLVDVVGRTDGHQLVL